MVIAGTLLAFLTPISKDRTSASYVILTLELSGLVFYGIHFIHEKYHLRLPFLSEWGRNPLILYLLHYVLLALFALPPFPAWYIEAPFWLVIAQLTFLITTLSWVGVYLDRRKLYFVL